MAKLSSEVTDLNMEVSMLSDEIASRYSTIKKTLEDIEQMGQESDHENEQASVETLKMIEPSL